MSSDYPAFVKIPRLFRDIVVTEKIDGTNGLIAISEEQGGLPFLPGMVRAGDGLIMRVGSRNRWLTPEQDNFGFANWATPYASELAELGPGLHYGEWWGSGIQRGYGLTKGEKRFSLFNTGRWNDYGRETNIPDVPGLGVVPVLYEGDNRIDYAEASEAYTHPAEYVAEALRRVGSVAAPGFMRPEGIIIYHTAARTYSKVTLDNDGVPKGQAA